MNVVHIFRVKSRGNISDQYRNMWIATVKSMIATNKIKI